MIIATSTAAPFLNEEEFLAYIKTRTGGWSRATLYRRRKQGLAFYKDGGFVRYLADDFDRFMARRRKGP